MPVRTTIILRALSSFLLALPVAASDPVPGGPPDGASASRRCGECQAVGGPQSVGIFLVNLRRTPGPGGSLIESRLPGNCSPERVRETFFSTNGSVPEGSVNEFYIEMSQRRMWLTGDIIGTVTVDDPDPENPRCFPGPMLIQAVDEAARAANLNFTGYSRRVYITAPRMGCRTAASGGPAGGGVGVPVSIFGGGCPAASNAVHEIGHTFGLGHSMLDTSFGGGPWGTASQESGDVMGFSGVSTPFNVVHREQLGWLSRERKRRIDAGLLQPGAVIDVHLSRLHPDDPDNEDPQAVIIPFPDGSGNDFHFSFRQAEGLDRSLDQPIQSPGLAGGPYLNNLSIHWFNRYCPDVYGDEFQTVKQRSYLLKTLQDGEEFSPQVSGAVKLTFRQVGLAQGKNSLHVQIVVTAGASSAAGQ